MWYTETMTKTEAIRVRLEPELLDKLEKFCAETQRSQSNVIRQALADYIRGEESMEEWMKKLESWENGEYQDAA